MVLSTPTTNRPNYAAAANTGTCSNAGRYPSPLFFILLFLESLNLSLQLNLSKSQRKEGDRALLGSGRGYCIREEEVVSGEEESVVSERYCSTEAEVLPPSHWNELDPWCSGSIRGRPDLDEVRNGAGKEIITVSAGGERARSDQHI
jgi:hypothetical protein